MVRIFERGGPVDMVTVTDELRQMESLSLAGGGQYIADLSNFVPSTSNAGEYIRIVEEKYLLRRLIQAAAEIQEAGYRASEEVDLILDFAEKQIFSISSRKTGWSTRRSVPSFCIPSTGSTNCPAWRGEVIGLPTGFVDLTG